MESTAQRAAQPAGQPTPQLDRLLTRLRAGLRGLAWRQGLGVVLLGTGGWLAFAFLADRWLDLPRPVRLLHTAILVATPIVLVVRDLARRLAKVPGPEGLAVLLDRAHPESQDRLVSSLQLRDTPQTSPARPLIDRLVTETEALAPSIEIARVLDPRQPNRRLLSGLGVAALAVTLLAAQPALARTFLERALGANTPWPRATTLALRLAGSGEAVAIGELRARVARGSDLDLVVEVQGEVPEEVTVHFADGSASRFRTGGSRSVRPELRNLQRSTELWVTGGDDQRGEPRLVLEVVSPPDVLALTCVATPPAYTGLEPVVLEGTELRVLQGSELRLGLLLDPPTATGQVRVLGTDRVLPLEPGPVALVEGGDSETTTVEGWTCTLLAEEDRYFQVELQDPTGMTNPDPGTWAIRVEPDRKPEVVLLAPDPGEHLVVAGGAVGLRVRVADDFAVAEVRWDAREASDLETAVAEGALELRPAPAATEGFGGPRGVQALAGTRLELAALAGEGVEAGWSGVLQVMARDSHPSPDHEALGNPVRLRCVSADEYLRRLKDGLARGGETAGRMLSEATELRKQAGLTVAALETGEVATDRELAALVHGARRVEGDGRSLGRDLAGLTEGLAYTRIDGRAGAALDALDRRLQESGTRTFEPALWRALVADLEAGRLGSPDLVGELLTLTGMTLEVSEATLAQALEALTRARAASAAEQARSEVIAAEAALTRAVEQLDALTTRLGEWDNFQSVLTLTRDILNRQKNLTERTRKFAEENR
jgi:hypothetical protein